MNYAEYKHFLERYTGRDVPDGGTLCGPYVAVCHDETVRQIRSYVTGKKIWVSIDERYVRFGDATRPDRCVRNVIVGTLEPGKPGKMFLLTVEESRDGGVSDHLRVGALLDDAMRLLWPDGIRTDDVLLFLSEPVEHLLRAIDSARAVYTKMVHVTGAPDGKHRVVERVDKPLAESIALVDRCVADELARGCGCSGLRDVLYATAGYETMRAISRIVDGQVADYVADMPEDLDAGDLPFFEYAPVTLVDLDGSYATYTNMLANAVPLYGFEIAKKTVVIQCNNTVLHGIRYDRCRLLNLSSAPGGGCGGEGYVFGRFFVFGRGYRTYAVDKYAGKNTDVQKTLRNYGGIDKIR